MADQFENCTAVTDLCPIEATTYGYRPNLGATIFFLAIFALCGIIQLFQGLKWKTWTFMIAMTWGCLTEVLGALAPSPIYRSCDFANTIRYRICRTLDDE